MINSIQELSRTIDISWVLLCGFLVVLMQAGFTCLESGMVRTKNSINVAIKNLIDFAGATVVHSVAGWMALAAILIIGPRLGRFGPDARPIEGHSLPIATLGVFLLWFGWFGFNGGSVFALNDRVLPIIINTALAGTSGGLLAMFVSWKILGKPVVDRIINGVIAGLVSITASVHLTPPLTAIFIGAVGGIVCVFGMMVLERWKIDDAIGAVPAHLFAGMGHLGCRAHPCGPLGDRWGTGLTR